MPSNLIAVFLFGLVKCCTRIFLTVTLKTVEAIAYIVMFKECLGEKSMELEVPETNTASSEFCVFKTGRGW